jgi:hypothetical protein
MTQTNTEIAGSARFFSSLLGSNGQLREPRALSAVEAPRESCTTGAKNLDVKLLVSGARGNVAFNVPMSD